MAKKQSTKVLLNKYLKELDKAALEKEVKKLYTKLAAVKDFYAMELSEDASDIIDKYKEKIRKEYMPNRGFGRASSSASRKVITDFKKIAVFKKDIIDLMLYRAEMMMEYTLAYGDIDEAFYNSLATSFDNACKLIASEKLRNLFLARCQELIDQSYGIGWGLGYDLKESYQDYLQ